MNTWSIILTDIVAVLTIVGIVWGMSSKWTSSANKLERIARDLENLIHRKDFDHKRFEEAIIKIADHQYNHDQWHINRLSKGKDER